MRALRLALLAAVANLAGSAVAHAHIDLNVDQAVAGSNLRAVFALGHGCGEAGTTAIRIRLDPRIVSARPMAKPGWDVKVTRETVKQKDGTSLQVPREIAWTGSSVPSDFYDEFVMQVKMPDGPVGSPVYFPVVQECGSVVERWIEMPLAGEDPHTLGHPAPFVTLTDVKGGGDHAH
jgi:uncharacterized protein YcnI